MYMYRYNRLRGVSLSAASVTNISCLSTELIRMFEEENTDDIVINYGEFVINSVQINQQIFRDLRWAALSMFLAGVMLRVGSGSNFMTFAGLFQIIVRTFRTLHVCLNACSVFYQRALHVNSWCFCLVDPSPPVLLLLWYDFLFSAFLEPSW